jgi:hypothetical protein
MRKCERDATKGRGVRSPTIVLISSTIPEMTTLLPCLPIVLPAQGMTSGPSAPAMELGIAGNGVHDGPEESEEVDTRGQLVT